VILERVYTGSSGQISETLNPCHTKREVDTSRGQYIKSIQVLY
jgi:hypothetical protein